MCADPSPREGTYLKEAFKAVMVGARSLQWTDVSIGSVSVEVAFSMAAGQLLGVFAFPKHG